MPFPTDWNQYLGIGGGTPYWEQSSPAASIPSIPALDFRGLTLSPNVDSSAIVRAIATLDDMHQRRQAQEIAERRQQRMEQHEAMVEQAMRERSEEAARRLREEQDLGAAIAAGLPVREALLATGARLSPTQAAQIVRSESPGRQYGEPTKVTIDGKSFVHVPGSATIRPLSDQQMSPRDVMSMWLKTAELQKQQLGETDTSPSYSNRVNIARMVQSGLPSLPTRSESSATKFVRVKSPDGTLGRVPEDKLEAAIKKGYTRAD